jgi:hypothetical protein
MRWRDNPYSQVHPRWQLEGGSRWAWRAILVVIPVVLIAGGNYLGAGIYVGLWIVGEAVALRDKRQRPGPGEGTGELGEDR